jgi:hypothetical protein
MLPPLSFSPFLNLEIELRECWVWLWLDFGLLSSFRLDPRWSDFRDPEAEEDFKASMSGEFHCFDRSPLSQRKEIRRGIETGIS